MGSLSYKGSNPRTLDCKLVDTPIDVNHMLELSKGAIVDIGRHQWLVGKLIYLSHTWSDLAFAVSMVSQFMHSPHEEHLHAVYKILRWLKQTLGKGLLFKKGDHMRVEAFTDANWDGSLNDRRSNSRDCIFVGCNLVTKRSKNQEAINCC